MTQRIRNSIACVAALLIVTGCSERMGRGWDWNRMRNQPRYQPYRDSRFFADGKAMQLPPAGTMSRESGEAAAAPATSGAAAMARGKSQYHIYCAVCHGDRGDGVSIVATNMEPPQPPSLITAPVSLMPASVVETVIANGAGSMPAFAAELSATDRRSVAEYVKTLQPVAGTDAGAAPAGR